MELGISPIVTSSMILQLLAGLRIIDVNMSVTSDKALFNTASKLLAIVMSICEGYAYIYSGAYGSPSVIGLGNCLIILI